MMPYGPTPLQAALEGNPDEILAPYLEFSEGGELYYFTPGGFLYRREPGTEEIGGFSAAT